MKLPSRKRLGQSDFDLAFAVFYSFFLHAAVIFIALLVHYLVIPKTFMPVAYHVKLVGQPREIAPAPAAEPALPKKEPASDPVKPAPKPKKAAAEPKKTAPRKDSVPELARQKPTASQQKKPGPAPASTAPPAPPIGAAQSGDKAEGVAISAASQQYQSDPYLNTIRGKIAQNWNPPPGVRNMRVKAQFSILRSGRIGDPKLELSSGNFYFDQAAMRAILSSSPFPPLPETFYQESVMFSVDLMQKE